MIFRKKRPGVKDTKFCPVCGTSLKISDAFCTVCGYSFEARHKSRKSKVKWKRLIVVALIIIGIYLYLRYSNGQPIIPDSLKSLLNLTSQTASK